MAMLKCVFCKTEQKADKTVKAILCHKCTARLAGTPQEIGKYPKSDVPKVKKVKVAKKVVKKVTTGGWGRGWHLKKTFKAPDGQVYSFGRPI